MTKENIKLARSARRRRKLSGVGRFAVTSVSTVFLLGVSLLFIMPIVLTLTNSFMAQSEIAASYGKIFTSVTTAGTYVSDKVNLKLIPDLVSFSQYETVLLKTPDYLFKFWNSVILVLPIVLFQTVVALVASYGFARFETKARSLLFFIYIILMLMPYQVTLVPNYIVSEQLGILNTRGDSAGHLLSLRCLYSDEIHAPHPFFRHRGGQAGRRGRVADLYENLRAHVQGHRYLRGDPGVHRLLEYGGTAAGPDGEGSGGSASAVRVPLRNQYRRRGTGLRCGVHLHDYSPPDLPLLRGLSGGGSLLLRRSEGISLPTTYDIIRKETEI